MGNALTQSRSTGGQSRATNFAAVVPEPVTEQGVQAGSGLIPGQVVRDSFFSWDMDAQTTAMQGETDRDKTSPLTAQWSDCPLHSPNTDRPWREPEQYRCLPLSEWDICAPLDLTESIPPGSLNCPHCGRERKRRAGNAKHWAPHEPHGHAPWGLNHLHRP